MTSFQPKSSPGISSLLRSLLHHSKHRSGSISSSGTMVCDNCADLNLKAALEGTLLAGNGCAASKRNPSTKWFWVESQSCDFCRFWMRCLRLAQERGPSRYPLRWIKFFPPIVFTSQHENSESTFELVGYHNLHDVRAGESKVLIGRCVEPETEKTTISQGAPQKILKTSRM